MAIVYVGRVGSGSGASGNATITVGAGGVAAGHSIIVTVGLGGASSTAPTIADTQGNTYALDVGPTTDGAGNDWMTVRSAHNVTALVSGNTIVVTNPTNTEWFVTVEEFSGLTGVKDGTNSAGAATGTAAASGAITTTNAVDLAFGACYDLGLNGSVSWSAPWTDITPHLVTGQDGMANAYQILSATGSPNAQATISSGAWVAAIVAYKGSGGAVASAFPVFLPRRLGPKAVGPTFFAALPIPPSQPHAPPPPPAYPPPMFLPRRLGPKAVGPTFFAPLPQPAGPGIASPSPLIWPPPLTFPSIRNRTFFIVRGRRVMPVPLPDPPILYRQPRSPRREPVRRPRGQFAFPVQPQVPVPPTVPGNRSPMAKRTTRATRGGLWCPPWTRAVTLIWPPVKVGQAKRLLSSLTRGKRTLPPIAQDRPVRPSSPPAKFGGWRRGKQAAVTPPQIPVPPTIPGNRWNSARSRLAALVHGRTQNPTPASQTAPALIWPPTTQRSLPKPSLLRRGKQVGPVPSQIPVPPTIPGNRTPAGRRWALLRKGRRYDIPAAPPIPLRWPPPKLGAARRLLSGTQRGRQATPTSAQVPIPKLVVANWRSTGRRLLGLLRRGRRADTPPTTVIPGAPAPTYPYAADRAITVMAAATQPVNATAVANTALTPMVRTDALAPMAYGADRAVTPMVAADTIL